MLHIDTSKSLFATKKGKPVEAPVPLAPLADTHGHLTSFRKLDPAMAVARAALVGVRLLVVPVDPADDVRDVAEFCAWFRRVRDEAARLLDECGHGGAAAPDVPGGSELMGRPELPSRPEVPGGPYVSGKSNAPGGPDAIDWPDVPELVDNLHFVAGVHPYGARKLMEDPSVRQRLEALLDDPLCVGVGEFGLDVGPWSELTLDEQLPAMRLQLRIAHERGLPVELHLRDGEADGAYATAAHDAALELLREEGVPAAGCDLHCFTSGPEVMAPFAEMGCYVAFGGAATFGRSSDIRAAAAACPEHLILSETDSPYMAPVPLRGQECEPAMVAFNAQSVARVREEAGVASPRQTYEALWRNAQAFFHLG